MTGGGDLYFRVAFDKPSSSDGIYGTVASEWSEQFQVRAGIRNLVGSEPVIAQRLQGIQPAVIRVRASSDTELVDPSWRCRDVNSGIVYQIKACTPDVSRRWIDVLVTAGVAA